MHSSARAVQHTHAHAHGHGSTSHRRVLRITDPGRWLHTTPHSSTARSTPAHPDVWVGVADVGQHSANELGIEPHQLPARLLHKLLRVCVCVRVCVSVCDQAGQKRGARGGELWFCKLGTLDSGRPHGHSGAHAGCVWPPALAPSHTLIHFSAVMRVNSSWLEALPTRMAASAT
jgi:hypothetical protein